MPDDQEPLATTSADPSVDGKANSPAVAQDTGPNPTLWPRAWRWGNRHPCLIIGFLALLVRMLTLPFVNAPGYMDAYYYYDTAERLYHQHGFTEIITWNYLSPPAPLEHMANLYWMPLQSVAIWFFFLIFGEHFSPAAQLPAIFASAALASLSSWVSLDTLHSRRYAWWAGLFTIFGGFWFPNWVGSDHFALFSLLGAATLTFSYLALRDDPRFFVPAGVCAGLAYLTRADGLLLVATIPLVWLLWRLSHRTSQSSGLLKAMHTQHNAETTPSPARPPLPWLLLGLLATLVTVAPWLIQLSLVTGTPFPPGAIKAAFLHEYNDIFFYRHPLDLNYFLSQRSPSEDWGLWPMLLSKLKALAINLSLWGNPTFFYLAPLFVLGFFVRPARVREAFLDEYDPAWLQENDLPPQIPPLDFGGPHPLLPLWRRTEFWPFWLYSLMLYLLVSLVFTFPGTRGTIFHTGGVLLPFVFPPAFLGLDTALLWLGRYFRPGATLERQRVYTIIALLGAMVISIVWTVRSRADWQTYDASYQSLALSLSPQLSPDTPVMVADPPAFYYFARKPAVQIPSDPDGPAAAAAAATRYHVAFLVLDPRYMPESYTDLYNTENAPGWTLAETLPPDVKVFRPISPQ